MSLNLDSAPRRSYGLPIVVAVIILTAAIGAAFYFNPHHTADLSVTHTDIFAPLTTFKTPMGSLHIVGQAPHTEQHLYAVVTVHLQDNLRLPLFLDEVDGRYTAADGTTIDAVSPSAADLARTEEIFPQIKPLLPHPLSISDTVPPQTAVDGQILLHFGNIGEKDWQTRKPSTLTIHFTHQDPITATIR